MSLNLSNYQNTSTEDLTTPIAEIGLWRAAFYRAIADIETYHLHEDPSLERYVHAKEARAWFQSTHQTDVGSFEWISQRIFSDQVASHVMSYLRKKYKPEIPKPKLHAQPPTKRSRGNRHPYTEPQLRYAFVD